MDRESNKVPICIMLTILTIMFGKGIYQTLNKKREVNIAISSQVSTPTVTFPTVMPRDTRNPYILKDGETIFDAANRAAEYNSRSPMGCNKGGYPSEDTIRLFVLRNNSPMIGGKTVYMPGDVIYGGMYNIMPFENH